MSYHINFTFASFYIMRSCSKFAEFHFGKSAQSLPNFISENTRNVSNRSEIYKPHRIKHSGTNKDANEPAHSSNLFRTIVFSLTL